MRDDSHLRIGQEAFLEDCMSQGKGTLSWRPDPSPRLGGDHQPADLALASMPVVGTSPRNWSFPDGRLNDTPPP